VSDLLVAALKIAFLAGMWLFVLLVANVIRNDLLGRELAPAEVAAVAASQPEPQSRKRRRGKEPRVLAIDTGSHAGARLQLVDVVRIGRSADCELLLDDDYASTSHATLALDQSGRWILNDLGSTNGTFVNENRVTAPTVITPADTIRIGRTQMRVEAP